MATPSYVNEGTAAQEAAPTTNLTPGLPASIVAGNFLLLVVVTRGTSADNTDPSGWTLLASAVETISNYTFKVYGRIATGSESAPSIAWTGGGTDFGQAHIFQYTDNDTTSVEAATEAVSAVANGADVSVELPSVTAGGSERLAIQVVSGRGTDGSPSASSSPGGNYSLNDSDFYNGANLTIAAYSASLAGGGTVSGESISFTTANAWYAVGFALVGAADGGGGGGGPPSGLSLLGVGT